MPMKSLRLSWILVLLALAWSLNAASLLANGPPSQEPKSSAPLPSTKQQISKPPAPRIEQQSQSNEKGSQAHRSPVAPIEPVSQPTADTEKKSTANQPERYFHSAFAPSMAAAWAQVVVGAIGLFVIWRTLKAVELTAQTARDEFLATHRPQLRVRQVEFIESNGLVKGVRYTVHNAGDSEGVITEVSERLWLAEVSLGLRLMPSYRAPGITRITGITLKPGGHAVSEHIHPDGEGLNFQAVFDGFGVQDNKPLFLGYISYKDQAGTVRKTAFLREYDRPTRRFAIIDHPDYEYQD